MTGETRLSDGQEQNLEKLAVFWDEGSGRYYYGGEINDDDKLVGNPTYLTLNEAKEIAEEVKKLSDSAKEFGVDRYIVLSDGSSISRPHAVEPIKNLIGDRVSLDSKGNYVSSEGKQVSPNELLVIIRGNLSDRILALGNKFGIDKVAAGLPVVDPLWEWEVNSSDWQRTVRQVKAMWSEMEKQENPAYLKLFREVDPKANGVGSYAALFDLRATVIGDCNESERRKTLQDMGYSADAVAVMIKDFRTKICGYSGEFTSGVFVPPESTPDLQGRQGVREGGASREYSAGAGVSWRF